eukprot:TRINITY_DN5428_c0_g1_i1.p1 TRINITY_DN5428_c0_g1~~TRINITY_DN5428_c0_g1_i1.p1  ORF type:complete len:168 (+),score=25.73 TRINITY_DN5428_c0_g1_i1:157-660(+)
MEFPELDTHCGFDECKQLDFLPFECNRCNGKFCLDHRTYNDHKCKGEVDLDRTNGHTVLCPLCNDILPVPFGSDSNSRVEEHISKGCPKKVSLKPHKCSKPNCKKSEAMRITCKSCGLNYCLQHRFERDHQCKMNLRRQSPSSSSQIGPFIVSNDEQKVRKTVIKAY